jgi:hypothetical protein
MKSLLAFLTALTIPIMFLNMLGGLVSGIWLAILREWGAIGTGVILFFVSTGMIGILLMPSMIFMAPATLCAKKGETLGLIFFGALGNIYTIVVLTAWCCGILFLFMKDATATSLIPRLIWSYGVATGPWAYIASRENRSGGGDAAAIGTFFAELAYLVIILLVIFTPLTFLGAIQVFGGFMAVGFLIQMTFALIYFKEVTLFAEQAGPAYPPQGVGSADP